MSCDLLQAWEDTLRRLGSHKAVLQASDQKECTFRELDQKAAAWLAEQSPLANGGLAGRAVVFSVANGIDWFVIFLGLLKAGAVIVPVDSSEPRPAQRRLAEALRAGFLWDGGRLLPLPGSRRYRDPVCLLKLTSGTKGAPRPLAFTAPQLLADARQVMGTMGIGPGDLNYALIPLGHSYGLGNLTIPLVAGGVPLLCGDSPLPHAIANDFSRSSPTVFPGVPAVWRALAESTVAPASMRSLRLAISAGAPLPAEVARAFLARLGIRLHNFYGSSETGGIAFDRSGDSTLAGGVGSALRSVRVAALRGQRIQVCSAAVFTKGNRRLRGRLGCWIPTDRVRLGKGGELQLSGRRGTMVKIAGRRVNLGEIEAVLRGLKGIRDAWVQVGSGADGVLGAVVATDRPISELRAELSPTVAPWKIPRKLIALPSLPLSARGKVDARRLSALLFG
jgi:long-chain acyl-CoA synthetase